MARTRSSGVGPYVVALVFFGLLFVVALILAILFYTRIEAAQATAKKATAELGEFASSIERSDPVVTALRGGSGSDGQDSVTVLGQLLSDNGILKQALRGDPEAPISDIQSAMDDLSVSQGNLLGELTTQRSNLEEEKRLVKSWNTSYEEANDRRKEADKEKTELANNYTASVKSLQGQLDQMRLGLNAFQQKLEEQKTNFNSQLSTLRSNSQQKQIDFESQLAQKDQVIDRLNRRIAELIDQVGARGVQGDVDPALLPDGYIASILSDQQLVYIDLGRVNHIVRGMTFEVYDHKVGIVRDAFGDLRGKATVEVVTVGESASKCRIVRTGSGREILEGDVVANAVYDPNMVFKFFVYGEFDIDNTGQATRSDRQRIEGMVRRWGAQLVPSLQPGGSPAEITYDVDFLVLGKEPPLPEEPSEDVVDPVVLSSFDTAKKQYETYYELSKEAKSLSIPILNLNRFLTMTGHYQR
jgi:hypothetical protein